MFKAITFILVKILSYHNHTKEIITYLLICFLQLNILLKFRLTEECT